MSEKQTAVEKLIDAILVRGLLTKELRLEMEEALQMEKEQIENAFESGTGNEWFQKYANKEQYYTETYGNK
jgi:trehalose-6-phosphate synthase